MFHSGTVYEVHTAIVVDNDDPEKRGRIKVQCDTLCGPGGIWPDFVPPLFPYLAGDGSATTAGWFFTPDVGTIVEVEVASASRKDEVPGSIGLDAPNIRWRACLFAPGGDAIHEDFQANYPNRRGVLTNAGHGLIFDDTADDPEVKLQQVNADGVTFLDFDENGSAMIATSRGQLFFMDQDNSAISLIDDNANALVLNSNGWYITDANSTMISAIDGVISLQTSDSVLINASGVLVGVDVAATGVLVDGLPGFMNLLALALADIITGLGAVPYTATAVATLKTAVESGAFVSTRMRTD